MIKMYINNEEVVCDKELTINEELLTTSSTTLKNCYPKSWELTKDYVNNFYFPPDYSKCLIYNENVEQPGIEGETIEATIFNINNNNLLQNEIQRIYGDTFQQTYSGKNLFNKNNLNTIDGYIGGSSGKITAGAGDKIFYISIEPNTTYTISKVLSKRFRVGCTDVLPADQVVCNPYSTNQDNNTEYTITSGNSSQYMAVYYYTASDTLTEEQILDSIQIEKGSTATSYEPYVGGEPSPNPSYPQSIQNITGNQNINICKKNIFNNNIYQENSTFNNSGNIIADNNNNIYKTYTMSRQIYTLTLTNNGTTTQTIRVYSYKKDGTQISLSAQFFVNANETKYFVFYSATNSQYFLYNIPTECTNVQLEVGRYSTSYEPYKAKTYTLNLGSMELCKVGTYQDYIYKNNGNWFKKQNVLKISSYNGQTIDTTYISTTGQLTTGATIYYGNPNPTDVQITDTNLINQLENLPLYNKINNVNMINNNLQGTITLHYNFQNEEIVDKLIFCGVVKNTGNIDLNPRQPHYCSLQVLDFKTFLSEGETLDFVISNKTISEAIDMVVNTVAPYGFEVGNVDLSSAGDIIGAYSTLDKTAYDVLQYIADITQSRWFTRMIDENKIAIDFYDPEEMPQAPDIEYNQQYYEDNNIIDIKYNYSTQDYRNKQIMLSDEVFGSVDYNDTIIADGYNTTFSVLLNIGILKAVSVNGLAKTIATGEEKEIGIQADFYYSQGSNVIESDELYSAGDEIAIVYTPLVKGRQIIYNDSEITRINNQTGRKGVVARYETRNDTLSSDELQKIGESYIKYKGKPEIKLTIKTHNKDLYNIGYIVDFSNPPLNQLQLTYMVKKKSTQIIGTTGDIFYTYELTSSYNSESAINFFDNQRAKAQGNIVSGESVVRNIDVENTSNIIFDNLTITEITVEDDNILNATLNAPLNS